MRIFLVLIALLFLKTSFAFAEQVKITRNKPIYPEHRISDDLILSYQKAETYPLGTIYYAPRINGRIIHVGNENVDLPDVVNSERVFCNLLGLEPIERDINESSFDVATIPGEQVVAILHETNHILFEEKQGERKGIPSTIMARVLDLQHIYEQKAPLFLEGNTVETNYYFNSMYCKHAPPVAEANPE